MDGNFKAEHMWPKNPANEVWLMDGMGFMVTVKSRSSPGQSPDEFRIKGTRMGERRLA